MDERSNGPLRRRPPFYSFAKIPAITTRDAFWEMKKNGHKPDQQYKDIVLARNTGMGIYLSGFALLMGFSLVWHILWLGVIGLVGVISCVIIRSLDEDTEYVLSAAEVAQIEASRRRG